MQTVIKVIKDLNYMLIYGNRYLEENNVYQFQFYSLSTGQLYVKVSP
jgi:hypothetical protein